MPDRKKVIKGLECCAVGAECDHCPYSSMNNGGFQGCYQMHQDALALLKAQEPVEWMRDKMRGYASALKSTETAALVMVMQMWEDEQEAQDGRRMEG